MLFKNITILDENFEIKNNYFVGVADGKIEYVGDKAPAKDYGCEYDGKGKLLMPGFVNAHAHSPMTLLRGYGENLALQDWLNTRIFPFEAKLDGNAVYWGTLLAMAESLRTGIVSTSDMYYFTSDMVKAYEDAGAKANVSRAITNFTGMPLDTLEAADEMKAAYKDFHMANGGKIRVDMSLHAEYTNDAATIKDLADYTRSIGVNQHVHISETKGEHEACKEKYGMTPVQFLNSKGLFDVPTTAAHCVWIEGEDYDIFKEKGVTVAVNAISNMKLSSGVCNVQALLDKGINVAIGTDSVSSNNSLNFLEDMKIFAMAGKCHFQDPTIVTPTETLYAATRGGAISQGRMDCGLIKEGFCADIVVLDVAAPNMYPIHDMKNNVVYSADPANVVLTMVDGKVLYENGEYKTIDVERAMFEVGAATDKILSQLAEG